MTLTNLPEDLRLTSYQLLDWTPRPQVTANPALLKTLNKTRSRQSAISKQRQNFISGVSFYKMTKEELDLKRLYIEDWHHRIDENVW